MGSDNKLYYSGGGGIADRNLAAEISFGVAGAAVVSGLAVLFWPSSSGTISASAGPGGAAITYARPLAF